MAGNRPYTVVKATKLKDPQTDFKQSCIPSKHLFFRILLLILY